MDAGGDLVCGCHEDNEAGPVVLDEFAHGRRVLDAVKESEMAVISQALKLQHDPSGTKGIGRRRAGQWYRDSTLSLSALGFLLGPLQGAKLSQGAREVLKIEQILCVWEARRRGEMRAVDRP